MLHNHGKQLENCGLRLTPVSSATKKPARKIQKAHLSDLGQEVLSLNASVHNVSLIMNTEPNMLCLDVWRHVGAGYVS